MRLIPTLALLSAAALLPALAGCNAEGGLSTTKISGIWSITVPTSYLPHEVRIT